MLFNRFCKWNMSIYGNKLWSVSLLCPSSFFFQNYQIAFNFKARVLLKPNLQYFFNNLKIIAIWYPLFCVDIRTRFKLPFWIGALRKYFKRTICFLFFVTIKKRCHTIGLHFSSRLSLTNNPYLGGFGEGVAKPPFPSKSTWYYPENKS